MTLGRNLIFVLSILILAMTGCGGGGGGDSSSNTNPSEITYTGLTTKALITEENATALSTGALKMSIQSTTMDSVVGSESNDLVYASNIGSFYQTLRNIDFASKEPGMRATDTGTEYGTCGGHCEYNISIDEATGAISGVLSYVDFCQPTGTMNGDIAITGLADPETGKPTEITMTLDQVNLTTNDDSIIMDGSMVFQYNTIYNITILADMRFKNGDDVYQLADYQIIFQSHPYYYEMEIFGDFYSPENGYVTIITDVSIRTNIWDDVYPHHGTIIVEGENGIEGGPTMSELQILSGNAYLINADTTGDGNFDWSSGLQYWE